MLNLIPLGSPSGLPLLLRPGLRRRQRPARRGPGAPGRGARRAGRGHFGHPLGGIRIQRLERRRFGDMGLAFGVGTVGGNGGVL